MVKAEYSPGQIELNLDYAEAMDSADRHVLFKTAAKELAHLHDISATFMAKWHHDFGGSSCHIHMSMLNEDGGSAFQDEAGNDTETLRHFLGGLPHHARDFFLFFAPNTNSYKRLVPNTFAPSKITWGEDNRTVAFRLMGEAKARRVENRIPGADINPYLCYSAMLAAGLYGIENQLEPLGQPETGNAYASEDGDSIPSSLGEATEAFLTSEVVAEILGDDVRAHYGNWGNQTLAAASRHVTDFERRILLHDI